MLNAIALIIIGLIGAGLGLTLAANYDSDSLAAPAQARREVLLV